MGKFSVHLIVQKDSAERIASSHSEFRAFSVGFSSALLVDFEVHALCSCGFLKSFQDIEAHTSVECGFYKSGKCFLYPSASYIWSGGSCRISHNSFWSISPNIEIYN